MHVTLNIAYGSRCNTLKRHLSSPPSSAATFEIVDWWPDICCVLWPLSKTIAKEFQQIGVLCVKVCVEKAGIECFLGDVRLL
jgi:hypothetical protein